MSRMTPYITGALALMAAVLGHPASAADESPLFDIPRLDNVIVDGQPDDWRDGGFAIETMASVDGWIKPADDMDSRVRLGWDSRGLLVLILVRDQSFVEADSTNQLYEGDSVELYLVDKRGGSQMIQAVISPGMSADKQELRYRLYDYRKDPALKAVPPVLSAARTKSSGGCVVEVLVPWSSIGVKPEVGTEVAFQVFANDLDFDSTLFHTVWYPATGTFMDSRRTHRVRLAERPSPPFAAVARGFSRLNDAWFTIVAASRLAGKTMAVRYNGNVMAEGAASEFGGRAFACVKAALPTGVVETTRYEITFDGQPVDAVTLQDLEGERGERRLPLNYAFHPFCFSGDKLPAGSYKDPAEIARRLGPNEVKVTYYDSALNIVTNAAKPGRYSAIVEVSPRYHPPMWRYYTLFRMAAPVVWETAGAAVKLGLPAELGLDAQVVSQQEKAVGDFARKALGEALAQTEDGATFLAWLHETPRDTPATQRFGLATSRMRWMHALKRRAGMQAPLKYRVELPRDVGQDPARKWPAILYLHGSGDRGAPVADLAGTAAVRCPRELKPDTFIVIAPRCPLNSWWSLPAIDDLLAEVLAQYPIDQDRLYLTGVSMGGYAAWQLLAGRPETFAAAVPLCGGGDPAEAGRFNDLPIWVFHGARDDAVEPARSREMVEALRRLNGRVRYTEYPDLGHNCWEATYSKPELYDWLLQQVRGKPQEPRVQTAEAGSDKAGR